MAIFFIKLVHTAIFLVMTACVIILFYTGIMNCLSGWTVIAIVLLLIEGIVLIFNKWQCPLTIWAEKLGAEDGSVTNIFLPRWLADRLFSICAPLFVIACIILIIQLIHN